MSTPFDPAPKAIPVMVVTAGELPASAGADILTLAPPAHDHVVGEECVACASQSDIRAMLFDLLQDSRQRQKPLVGVVVDARKGDAQKAIARLEPGRVPAMGLRDFTVARSFYLSAITP